MTNNNFNSQALTNQAPRNMNSLSPPKTDMMKQYNTSRKDPNKISRKNSQKNMVIVGNPDNIIYIQNQDATAHVQNKHHNSQSQNLGIMSDEKDGFDVKVLN